MTDLKARLSVYSSNRLLTLFGHFAETIAASPLPPARAETVVIQSQGMARWIHLRLAETQGVAAGFDMPFPRQFVHGLAERLTPQESTESSVGGSFSRDALTWRIFRHLELAAEDPAFAEAAQYFRDDLNGRRRLELASKTADLFDNYQLYRVELLKRWSEGADDLSLWQAHLWRRLIADCPGQDLATRLRMLQARINDPDLASSLPERITVFGIATLPPIFLDLLVGLSHHMPVAIYVVSPTPHYWGDITKRALLETADAEQAEQDNYNDSNPLLAALGKQGRDFFNMLLSADAEGSALVPLEFEDPGHDSALHTLQSDIYHLKTPGGEQKSPVSATDSSLQIHTCHCPLREMEVLRDRLLDLFDTSPQLDPGDVVVMLPDVEAYAPAVQAAFDSKDGAPRIPYSIADRRASAENPAARAVIQLLDLATSRTTASEVLDLLDIDCFRRAASISPDERSLVSDWAAGSGARWGVDAVHRHDEFRAPPIEANTWRFALDRMLIGRAVAAGSDAVLGIAPFEPSAGNADLLGRFIAFVSSVFDHCRALRKPRSLSSWLESIDAALADLTVAGDLDDEDALARARSALSTAVEECGEELAETPIEVEPLADYLRDALEQDGFGSPFLTGRVTFCAMKPMRSIPFSVVCMAGLDEGVFPRSDRTSGIDLIAADPRLGDRSVRDDDRYLFLESILAAERALVLSYVGRSIKDNTEREPSTVLSVLLDTVDETFVADDFPSAIARFRTVHPLQPFSKRYFEESEPNLFSYAATRCNAATRAMADRSPDPVFAAGQLRSDSEEPTLELTMTELLAFWRDPSRDFCLNVLGLRLPADDHVEEGQEPVSVDPLTRSRIGDRLLTASTDSDFETALRVAAASGELPPGISGDAALGQLRRDAERILPERNRTSHSLDVELEGNRWCLTGAFEHVGAGGLLFASLTNLSPWRRLAAWIHHVILNAAVRDSELSVSRVTTLIGRDGSSVFEALDDPAAVLDRLVEGYRLGRGRPMPFSNEASLAFAKNSRGSKPKPREECLDAAIGSWGSVGIGMNRRNEPYSTLVFRGQAPLSDDRKLFADWAETVFAPLLEAERKA